MREIKRKRVSTYEGEGWACGPCSISVVFGEYEVESDDGKTVYLYGEYVEGEIEMYASSESIFDRELDCQKHDNAPDDVFERYCSLKDEAMFDNGLDTDPYEEELDALRGEILSLAADDEDDEDDDE